MVGLQTLDLAIGVRVPASQPKQFQHPLPVLEQINSTLTVCCGLPWTKQSGLTTVEAYDPGRDTWTSKASKPTSRYGLGVAVVNGLLYAVGGHNTNIGSLGTLEAYDPVSDTWTTKASPEGL